MIFKAKCVSLFPSKANIVSELHRVATVCLIRAVAIGKWTKGSLIRNYVGNWICSSDEDPFHLADDSHFPNAA